MLAGAASKSAVISAQLVQHGGERTLKADVGSLARLTVLVGHERAANCASGSTGQPKPRYAAGTPPRAPGPDHVALQAIPYSTAAGGTPCTALLIRMSLVRIQPGALPISGSPQPKPEVQWRRRRRATTCA